MLWCREFATALRARDDVRGADSGDNEELSRGCGCRRMVQAGLKHDPDVGIRYGATLQFLLRRRSGCYDETESALEIES